METTLQQLRPSIGPLTSERIERAEGELLQYPQIDCPLTHRFAPGICIREVLMPANSLIIGHAHRFEDMNIMLTGRMTILNDDGTTKELKAPQTFLGKKGRKIAFIHEDVIWQNIFPTDLFDVEAIEEHFLDKSPTWKANAEQRKAIAQVEHQCDRDDYNVFMRELGFSEAEIEALVHNQADQVPFPVGDWRVQVSDSPIQGKGLFATGSFSSGQVIAPARVNGCRTPAGRYTNHSRIPNSKMEICPNGINLVAIHDIKGCAGGQLGEEITVDYRQALDVAKKLIQTK